MCVIVFYILIYSCACVYIRIYKINMTDRALTLDTISGRASRDYGCGIKEGDVIGTVDSLN